MNRYLLVLGLITSLMLTRATHAQFGTVINIPPDPNIGDEGGIGSGTQLNLKGGRTVGISFELGDQRLEHQRVSYIPDGIFA